MQAPPDLEYGIIATFEIDDKHPAGCGFVDVLGPDGMPTGKLLFISGAEEHSIDWSGRLTARGCVKPERPRFRGPLHNRNRHSNPKLLRVGALVVFRRQLVGARYKAYPWSLSRDVRVPVEHLATVNQ